MRAMEANSLGKYLGVTRAAVHALQPSSPEFLGSSIFGQYAIAILHAASGRIISNFGRVPVPGTEPPQSNFHGKIPPSILLLEGSRLPEPHRYGVQPTRPG